MGGGPRGLLLPQLPGWAVLGPDSHPWGAQKRLSEPSYLGSPTHPPTTWRLLEGSGAGSLWGFIPKNLVHPPLEELRSSKPPLSAISGQAAVQAVDTSVYLSAPGPWLTCGPGGWPAVSLSSPRSSSAA